MPPRRKKTKMAAVPVAVVVDPPSRSPRKKKDNVQDNSETVVSPAVDPLASIMDTLSTIREEAKRHRDEANLQNELLSDRLEMLENTQTDVASAEPDVSGSVVSSVFSVTPFQSIAPSFAGSYNQATAPADGHVSDELKHKIREGKFIEFRQLLPKAGHFNTVPQPQYVCVGQDNKMVLSSASKSDPLTWTEWCTCWNIYQCIILEHNFAHGINLVAGMAKHFFEVIKLLKAGHAWQQYDSHFRWAIYHDSSVHWGDVLAQALDEARAVNKTRHNDVSYKRKVPASVSASNSSQLTVKTLKTADFPKRYCWAFNNGFPCKMPETCKNSHSCFNCVGDNNHAFRNCSKPLTYPNWPHLASTSIQNVGKPIPMKPAFPGKS